MGDKIFTMKKVYGIIYCIKNLANNKLYVGKTIQKLSQRLSQHRCRKQTPVELAIQKYGWQNFKVEILQECSSAEELNEREKFWIINLNCKSPNGYNLTDGGEGSGGFRRSAKTRLKMSLSAKKRYQNPDEHTKTSNSQKGKIISLESRLKMSIAKKGKPGPRSKKVICVETGMVFNSITEAAHNLNISRQSVRDVCHGKHKTAGGYHWKFFSEHR